MQAPRPQSPKVNVRRPDIMHKVEARVTNHYESGVVNQLRALGGVIELGNTTIRLAQQFGFCYGVERAINLAYAAREVFPDNKIYLIGEIIHNPEVNRQLDNMGIAHLNWKKLDSSYDELSKDDVVVVPAFGAPLSFMQKLHQQGCTIVDTTCGDVMKVWRRIKEYAKGGYTSIIHGKANHEETQATASRALGEDGKGHYLIILTHNDCETLCAYLKNGGDKQAFLEHFKGAYSQGFDPDLHLQKLGVANQTTMLKSETEQFQSMIRTALLERDGGSDNFKVFDTICGATQERQDALFNLLNHQLDMLLVVGGYNSSNTTHLVEIGKQYYPTFFIRTAECLQNIDTILHFDLHSRKEVNEDCNILVEQSRHVVIGITAGASCPSNLIEDTIVRVLALRGIDSEQLQQKLAEAIKQQSVNSQA